MASRLLLLGHQETRRTMGVTATVTVHSTDPRRHIEEAFLHLAHYEALWSRFIPDSDISHINNSRGSATVVDPVTVELVRFMKHAHNATDGLYNPTLLPLHREAGDLDSLVDDKKCTVSPDARIWEHLDDISLESETTVRLPATMTLDAGGIGKGYAADLVVGHLLALGAQSVSVNLGGDARVASAPSTHESWNFDVVNLDNSESLSTISLLNGAIATSSLGARYRGGIGPRKHIFSAQLNESHVHTCSVIAGEARWAEVLTKYVMLSPSPRSVMTQRNLAALILNEDKDIFSTESWKEFEL